MTYRIYYGNGEIFEGEGPEDLPPARNVQVIVQSQPEIGWHTQSKYDHYVWREEQGRWVGVDQNGLWDFLLDTGLVLFGRTMIGQDFYDIMKLAVEDLGREKTGWLPDEEKLS